MIKIIIKYQNPILHNINYHTYIMSNRNYINKDVISHQHQQTQGFTRFLNIGPKDLKTTIFGVKQHYQTIIAYKSVNYK